MSIDIFSTHFLRRVVERLDRPSSFLLDLVFTEIQTEEAEEIHFDIDLTKPRLAPFVSPIKAGKVVHDDGYQTKSFKPAYVKDKRKFMPNMPLKRRMGEQIGGSLSGSQRVQAAIASTMNKQLEDLTRRFEWMAAQALLTGTVTVEGEGYPAVEVDFGRDTDLTEALTGSARWGQSGVNPLDDLETWSGMIHEKSGASARVVVMDPAAWKVFRADERVEKYLDIRRGGTGQVETGVIVRGQGNEKASYKGSIGDVDFWVYQERYVDAAGTAQKLLPDNTVLLLSPAQLEGTRCFAMIQDERAGNEALEFFPTSWLDDDPPIRWMMIQSAPLMVPYRPNASMRINIDGGS